MILKFNSGNRSENNNFQSVSSTNDAICSNILFMLFFFYYYSFKLFLVNISVQAWLEQRTYDVGGDKETAKLEHFSLSGKTA